MDKQWGRSILVVGLGLAMVVLAWLGVTSTRVYAGSSPIELSVPETGGFAFSLSEPQTDPGSATQGDVYVSGTLTQSTVWTAAESPYILDGSVTVPAGLTLTVEPGVTVIGELNAFLTGGLWPSRQ